MSYGPRPDATALLHMILCRDRVKVNAQFLRRLVLAAVFMFLTECCSCPTRGPSPLLETLARLAGFGDSEHARLRD